MHKRITNEINNMVSNIPKEFWKYYDLYRRKEISLEEYSIKADMTMEEIQYYLSVV